ncbi:MAG: ribosome maturation factor RimM [Blastocatellia bacterium AA13]|nr:MAG: ribosome maturation factor RimM [Blastocatellia bacterium AA13]
MSASSKNAAHGDVVIARIVKPHGVHGEVACDIETDFLERFDVNNEVRLRARDGSSLNLLIEKKRFVKDRVLLKFQGYDTMDAARGLVGAGLVIDESDRKQLEPDQFYEHELVGIEAVTLDGRPLGIVKSLLSTGSAPLLIIESAGGDEILIPFTSEICVDVDPGARRVTVNPPEGLLELNIKPIKNAR